MSTRKRWPDKEYCWCSWSWWSVITWNDEYQNHKG